MAYQYRLFNMLSIWHGTDVILQHAEVIYNFFFFTLIICLNFSKTELVCVESPSESDSESEAGGDSPRASNSVEVQIL